MTGVIHWGDMFFKVTHWPGVGFTWLQAQVHNEIVSFAAAIRVVTQRPSPCVTTLIMAAKETNNEKAI